MIAIRASLSRRVFRRRFVTFAQLPAAFSQQDAMSNVNGLNWTFHCEQNKESEGRNKGSAIPDSLVLSHENEKIRHCFLCELCVQIHISSFIPSIRTDTPHNHFSFIGTSHTCTIFRKET
jgi:hypothetical protein